VPTCPVLAPTLNEVSTLETFEAISKLIIRNCSLANFLDQAAISIPANRTGDPPTGLMLMACGHGDNVLLSRALAVEAALQQTRCR
jgi:aspartyl-tRNA(Asn)/glutamyl-tRNA(Gln) amidotransferase subunit A